MSSYLQHGKYEVTQYSSNPYMSGGYGYGYGNIAPPAALSTVGPYYSGSYSQGSGFGSGYGPYNNMKEYSQGSGFGAHLDNVQRMSPNTVVCSGGGLDLISALVPTSFPPGTDPNYIECFNMMDSDRNGSISDIELQAALSSFNHRFSLRTVHLLIYIFTASNSKPVTPHEFVPLIRCLHTWKASFQKFDTNRNGSMDEMELKKAMMSMGYNLSPFVLNLLVSKFAKSGAKFAIEYDYFIECCLVVKGLTEKFKKKEDSYTGSASFTYEEFLLDVLPFVIMN